ncbi:MAG: class I SAM-dependent methyltransferase [Nitrospira sp.]|nr:class I SAM-dependent methyltransferase [Nitrospira sp.]MBX3339091.1 class I SAM-dependent methyltransferase [Nitrospira sp.]MCW5777991.1 class I SAM-dependent methyltransferase [Nitrospira sp.]
MIPSDYSPVTEKADDWVTPEALSMVYTRYRFAADFCRGRRVLEVACGPGVGLGYLGRYADTIIGGDLTGRLLRQAQNNLQGQIPLVQLQAEALPLRTASRDLIVCYEALYFFEDAGKFLGECRRVLSPQGYLLLCSVNPEWPEFNPNAHGRRYYSAQELSALLRESGFRPDLFGVFPVASASVPARCLSWIKRVAVQLRLIPSSMAGKRLLKRLFLGKLIRFPVAIDEGMAAYSHPVVISPEQPVAGYKIFFAVCQLA